MSTTIQVSIEVADEAVKDMMIAELADLGFDGFEETETGLFSYIDLAKFDTEVSGGLADLVSRHGASFTSASGNPILNRCWWMILLGSVQIFMSLLMTR